MREKLYTLMFIASLLFAIAAIGNYLYYYYYPASRPVLYEGSNIEVIAYTTVSSKYFVLIPTADKINGYDFTYSEITIAGYTAPIKPYKVANGYTVKVAIIPTVFTMASKMTIGSYTLTKSQVDAIHEMNVAVAKTKNTLYLFLLSLLSLVAMPLYSRILELYEQYKIEKEEEEEEEEDEEEDEDEEDELGDEEEYLMQRYRIRTKID